MGIKKPLARQSVLHNKRYKKTVCIVVGPPHRYKCNNQVSQHVLHDIKNMHVEKKIVKGNICKVSYCMALIITLYNVHIIERHLMKHMT